MIEWKIYALSVVRGSQHMDDPETCEIVSKLINEHTETCEICKENRRRVIEILGNRDND
jgi:hypothetical protein